MKPTCHVLCTVRKDALLEGALLVFRSVRIGFPAANICVYGNGLLPKHERIIAAKAQDVGATFQNLLPTQHDLWINDLIARGTEPFWICDTDVVFWSAVDEFHNGQVFAGRLEPAFHEEYTRCDHPARLHTSLMWIDPSAVRCAMRVWMCKLPELWRRQAQFPFILQHFIPRHHEAPLFYDTMAGLYQAGFGTPFTDEQNKAFEHLHCSSYADEVAERTSLKEMPAMHQAIYRNPELARGLQVQQAAYYEQQQPKGKIL